MRFSPAPQGCSQRSGYATDRGCVDVAGRRPFESFTAESWSATGAAFELLPIAKLQRRQTTGVVTMFASQAIGKEGRQSGQMHAAINRVGLARTSVDIERRSCIQVLLVIHDEPSLNRLRYLLTSPMPGRAAPRLGVLLRACPHLLAGTA
jgi:hypothetical protein